MSDNKLNLVLKLAVVYLILSIIFCIFSLFYTQSTQVDMENNRLQNETEIAQMQMPEINEDSYIEYTFEEDEDEESIITPDGDSLPASSSKTVVVLDAGHGKSSSSMSSDEKTSEGYEYSERYGSWGEWRHYKNGTYGEDCYASGCTFYSPSNGSCWYPMGNGDRSTEPDINLQNTLAAKAYLEDMGYEVRVTRTSNEQNPSMNKRLSYCFPNNDTSLYPDAALYVCIHSNAGGGAGTSYISLAGTYTQSFIPSDYIEASNRAGDIINRKVAAASGLRANGPIGNEGWLILFNKCPVPIAYMEIGFFDNSSDLAILKSSHDEIGRAIAEGVDEYLSNY